MCRGHSTFLAHEQVVAEISYIVLKILAHLQISGTFPKHFDMGFFFTAMLLTLGAHAVEHWLCLPVWVEYREMGYTSFMQSLLTATLLKATTFGV